MLSLRREHCLALSPLCRFLTSCTRFIRTYINFVLRHAPKTWRNIGKMNDEVEFSQPTDLNITAARKQEQRYFFFRPISIQYRLPLFICILLTTVVLVFSWFSYLGVKDAAMATGTERLTTLVDKLSVIFKGSVDQFAAATAKVSLDSTVKEYLNSPRSETRLKTLVLFRDFLKKDTTNKGIELLNDKRESVLRAGGTRFPVKPGILYTDAVASKQNFSGVGRIIVLNKQMYFPVLVSVVSQSKVLGYIVNWKHLYATQQSIDQFGQLLGSNGKVYFGNDDGVFWTNLIKPVPKPPVSLSQLHKVALYSRMPGEPLLGSARKIANSRWLVLVELSGASFQETADNFLKRVITIGLLLIAAGSLGAWLMSRNITRPLKELGRAASAIADGNYSVFVHVDRQDELGKVAESFNIMSVRVRAAQENLEQQVEQTIKELQSAITDIEDQKESDKKKDEFISIASHELKTPLTTIKAFFQLAAKEISPDSKPFQLVGNASRQLMRMERLIGDLLDVSKINAGKMQYYLEDFNFQDLLTEATGSVQEIYPDHQLVLERNVSATVTADRHRIEQVIVNLLTNAIKYSPGKNKVLIYSELRGSFLYVSIEDFGIGIAEKHFGELFSRFYRVDFEHRFQGLGLGLFISAEIIKRHGGSIHVQSKQGKGSVFTFQLPFRP